MSRGSFAKPPSSSSLPRFRIEGGRAEWWPARGGGGPVHGGGLGMGQNGEEAEWSRSSCSPCAMAACRGGSTGEADWRWRRLGAAVLWCSRGRGALSHPIFRRKPSV
jgi:hypothetical protein